MAFRTPEYIAKKIEDTMDDPEYIRLELQVLENYRGAMDKLEKILANTEMEVENDNGNTFSGIDNLEDLAKEYRDLKEEQLQSWLEKRERVCRGDIRHDDEVGWCPILNEEDDGLALDDEDKGIIGLKKKKKIVVKKKNVEDFKRRLGEDFKRVATKMTGGKAKIYVNF